MIESVDEFNIVKNVIESTIGLKYKPNWVKVQMILLWGTDHSGSTSSCAKCRELGVDPDNKEWERVEEE